MDDPNLSTSLSVGAAFIASAIGVFKWLLGREVQRHDEQVDAQNQKLGLHEGRIAALEKTAISKEDLDRTESRIISAITEVRSIAHAAHERLDRDRERELDELRRRDAIQKT